MKKILLILAAFCAVLIAACTNQAAHPCPLNIINPDSCDFGTYTTTIDGCGVTGCRPTADFNCNNLSVGDRYNDKCNSCGCTGDGGSGKCTQNNCSPNRIKAEGDMCGGIAGFQCEPGLTCRMNGNYPDAAGTCINESSNENCPKLMPPGPNFCSNGTITPKYDDTGSCITGYTCETKIKATNLDYSCKQDSDCEVKNIGNCCGYYPACLNKYAVTDPEGIKADCEKNNLVSACGFPDIRSCSCVSGKCVAN